MQLFTRRADKGCGTEGNTIHSTPPGRWLQRQFQMPLADDAAVLISTFAFLGVRDPADGERSFAAGASLLEPELGGALPMKTGEECGLKRIDEALGRFEQASAPVKRSLLTASAKAATHDGVVASDEIELLRAVADAIDAPIPPLVDRRSSGG